MTFELFGIPGCGKTICCKRIEKATPIQNPMEFYKETFVGKVLFHLFLLTFRLNGKYRSLYQNALTILGETSYTNMMDKTISKELYLKYMMFVYSLEKRSSKSIVIDEGIIHYAIALHAEFDIEFEKLDAIIELLQGKNVTPLGISATVEECMGFIKKRNRKECSLDFLESNDLENMLNRYQEGLDYFSQKYKVQTIEEIVNYLKNGEN